MAGLHQQRARLLLAHPLAEIELVDDPLHVLLRRSPQRDLLAPRKALALALADLLALDRDGLHAFRQVIAGQQRHRQRQDGGNGRDRGEQHGHAARI